MKVKKVQFKKNKNQTFILCGIVLLAAIYIYLYSQILSFSNTSMQIIYLLLAVLVLLLKQENVAYVMFFMLPMRKLIYFGSLNFFNIIILAYLLRAFAKNRKLPRIPFLLAVGLAFYDVIISTLSLPSYTVTSYMLKWYLGFFLFLYMLARIPDNYEYKKGMLFLNVGLTIVGLFTISQYAGYDVITGGLRERLAGAGGTLDQNTYSFHCLIGAVSVLAFFLDPNSDKKNKMYNIIILPLGLFSMFCGMYMVSKGFYAVVAVLVILTAIKMGAKLIRYWKHFIVAIIGLYGAFQITRVQQLFNSVMLRFTGATDVNSLTTGRSDLYAYYINALLTDPIRFLFGAGLNTYRLVFNAHNNYITHNTTLEIIAAWGAPIAVIIVCSIIYLCRKNAFSQNNSNYFSLLPLLALLLFSQTVSMFWEDASLFYFVYAVYFAIHLSPAHMPVIQHNERE